MQIVTMILVLLLAVVVTSFCARLSPLKVPLPLLQIAMGAGLHCLGFEVKFDPHLFLLLFIPPLLFLDGWRIPKGALLREWKSIIALATGLVVFTVVGIGFFVNWLIPTVPLAVAFALAAILSPTDPVAVSAMTAHTPLPSRLMHILEGEALLNDATGLVCFSFAVTAALTSRFSLGEASLSFLVLAGGGVAVGLAVATLIGRANRLLVRRTGEDPAIQVLISLLIPFAAYLVAEKLHVSGILAAAMTGIAMHYVELSGRSLGTTRLQRNVVWNTVQTALNGTIFVILGEQLPHMLQVLPEAAADSDVGSAWHLVGYVVAITLALSVLRFVWAWVSLRLTLLRTASNGQIKPMPKTRLLAVMATAGVRGAVTLAGILTLPLMMSNGAAFPARDTAIFLAMGVILLSLLIASTLLPLLTRGLDTELPHRTRGITEDNARAAAAKAAVRRIEQATAAAEPDENVAKARADAAACLLDIYQRRLAYDNASDTNAAGIQQQAATMRRLRLQALSAERETLYRLRRKRCIDDDVHQRLVREIDLMEASLLVAGPR